MDNIKELTKQQELVLSCIQKRVAERGFPPSIREICAEVGLSSSSTVHSHIKTLVKKGFLEKEASKPRAIGVIEKSLQKENADYLIAPVLGSVAAGKPIFVNESIEEYMPIPKCVNPTKESFVLRVSGESMIKAGIYNNDYIFVNKQSHATNGDIVVALIEDEVTVKTYYREKNRIKLQPENDQMEPMYFKEVVILGKVVGVQRFF